MLDDQKYTVGSDSRRLYNFIRTKLCTYLTTRSRSVELECTQISVVHVWPDSPIRNFFRVVHFTRK